MSLRAAARVTLGNWRYDGHAGAVRVTLALLPGVNVARVLLPAGAEVKAAPGDDVLLELDGGDADGDGLVAVLTGTLRALRRGVDGTEAELVDAGAALAALRPCTTFQQQDAADIVSALAEEAGVDVGHVDLPDLSLAAFAAHQARTAAEHVAELCRLAGAIAAVDADGALFTKVPGTADAALLYGREFTAFEVGAEAPPARRHVLVGNGPAGSAQADDALRHSVDVLPGSAPAAGKDALRESAALLRTPDAASAAGEAADALAAARASRLTARAFLLPGLRPGAVIEVQGTPDRLAGGPWLVTRVEHVLAARRGGRTTLHARAAAAGGDSLLGALAGAVGGLL
jgi:hypothetical protein